MPDPFQPKKPALEVEFSPSQVTAISHFLAHREEVVLRRRLAHCVEELAILAQDGSPQDILAALRDAAEIAGCLR